MQHAGCAYYQYFKNDTIILFELSIEELVLSFEYLLCSSRSAPEPRVKTAMVSARASFNLYLLQNFASRNRLQSKYLVY